jgi:hypothetical protein
MISTYPATTSSQIVHHVYEADTGLGQTKRYPLCNGQVAHTVRKTDGPVTCKRCIRAYPLPN